MSDTSIGKWIHEEGFPVEKGADGRNLFVVTDVREWMSTRARRRPGPRPFKGEGSSGSIAEEVELTNRQHRARVLKDEAEAKLKQQKVDVAEGRYVERSVYEQDLVGLAALFRSSLSTQVELVRADHGDEAAELTEEVVERVWSIIAEKCVEILDEEGTVE